MIGIISAYKDGLTEAENEERYEKLCQELRHIYFSYRTNTAKWTNKDGGTPAHAKTLIITSRDKMPFEEFSAIMRGLAANYQQPYFLIGSEGGSFNLVDTASGVWNSSFAVCDMGLQRKNIADISNDLIRANGKSNERIDITNTGYGIKDENNSVGILRGARQEIEKARRDLIKKSLLTISDRFKDKICRMQWGVVAAFADENTYQALDAAALNAAALNAAALDAKASQSSRAVGGSQLHQASVLKERLRCSNIGQTAKLQQDLVNLCYDYIEVEGRLYDSKVSCFIVFNDYMVLTNAEWQARIERLARKYKQTAYIVGFKGKTERERFLPSRIEEKDECSRVFYHHAFGFDESIVQGIDDINSLLNSFIGLFKENDMAATFNSDNAIEF